MRQAITKLLIPMSFICMWGCSSNQQSESPEGYLATHIFDDGSKQFVYTVVLPESTGQHKGGGSGRPGNVSGSVQGSSNRGLSGGVTVGTQGGGKGRGSGRRRESRTDVLVKALEVELKETGYCRDGYMELDRMMQPSQTFIKGECHEAASAKDLEAFPNTED